MREWDILMHFKSIWIQTFLLVAALFCTGGCAKSNKDNDLSEDRLVAYLDAKKYDKLIGILEPEYARNPDNKSVAVFLAKAHLGKAGFEVLRMAARILGEQTIRNKTLARMIPNCTAEAIDRLRAIDGRCLFQRLLNNLPPSDNGHLIRARDIFRRSFSDKASIDDSTKVLIGIVETALVVMEAGKILLKYEDLDPVKASDEEMNSFFPAIAALAGDVQITLDRVRDIELQVSSVLTGNVATLLFEHSPQTQLIEQTAIPRLMALKENKKDDLEQGLVRTYVMQKLDDAVDALKR